MNFPTSDTMTTESTSGPQIFQLRLWHHLLLCAALFSNEVTITYELIYMVTWEKLLGLPVKYVSLAGVISSAISFVITPALARLGDHGERFQRKSLLVVASGCCMFVGAACLLAGCIVKMRLPQDYGKSKACFHSPSDANSSSVSRRFVFSGNKFNTESDNCTDQVTNDYEGEPVFQIMEVLSVVAFILVNIGYNTGCSYIRGFMLECVHNSQHSKVLSIGVIMSAVGGCLVALIGMINLDNDALQATDPNLVRAVALSLLVMIAVVVTIPTTLLHGRYLLKKLNEGKPQPIFSTRVSIPQERIIDEDCTQEVGLSNGIEKSIKPFETNGQNVLYKSIGGASVLYGNQDMHIDNAATKTDIQKSDSKEKEQYLIRQSQQDDKKANNFISIDNSEFIKNSETCYQLNEGTTKSCQPVLLEETDKKIKFSCWDKIRICFSNLLKSFRSLPSSILGIWKSYKKLSLLLSCLLCFFTAGANAIFEIYFTNYLAEGVYKGDGEAPQDDLAKQHYDLGIQTASIGTFVFQLVFLIYNAAHQRLSTETGLVYEFLIVSCLMVPSLLAFVLTESLLAFYVTIVLNGAYRTLIYTTPFILASETMRMSENGRINDFMTSEIQDDSYGSVISTVGAMMPLSFLLSSSLMGPLLEATLDPASPMYFVVVAATGAIVVLIITAVARCRKRRMLQTQEEDRLLVK